MKKAGKFFHNCNLVGIGPNGPIYCSKVPKLHDAPKQNREQFRFANIDPELILKEFRSYKKPTE